jgi:hypothetical protein
MRRRRDSDETNYVGDAAAGAASASVAAVDDVLLLSLLL